MEHFTIEFPHIAWLTKMGGCKIFSLRLVPTLALDGTQHIYAKGRKSFSLHITTILTILPSPPPISTSTITTTSSTPHHWSAVPPLHSTTLIVFATVITTTTITTTIIIIIIRPTPVARGLSAPPRLPKPRILNTL